MPRRKTKAQMNKKKGILIVITGYGLICFNFPVLQLMAKDGSVLGIPYLYFNIFVIWLFIILATAFSIQGNNTIEKEDPQN